LIDELESGIVPLVGAAMGAEMSEMTKTVNMDTAAISIRQVQERQAARSEKMRRRAELDREIAEHDKWLEAAKILFGTSFMEPFELTATAEVGDDESMAEASIRILNSSDLWTTYEQLRARLAENEKFAAMLENSPNYFYTLVRRLQARGEIERRAKLLRGLKKTPI
jgi:hypothetical protein